MKRKLTYYVRGKPEERTINYIPVRYILAGMLTLLEVAAIIGIVLACCYFIPYFYLAAYVTEIACVIKIIASDDNPDYKIPWLLFVLILPVAGFMLYFLFYSRKLQRKYIRRLRQIEADAYQREDGAEFAALRAVSPRIAADAKMLCQIADTHLYRGGNEVYFPSGEAMHASMLKDLQKAERFIFLEYFIIEEGQFWGSILEILQKKAADGVEVRVVYDDIGCMSTLPGDYAKTLCKMGIKATPFSRLRGNADSEFNNRNHRKLLVIDGLVGYTGGVNLADEYINKIERFGHWKDGGIRLEGPAVHELTQLLLQDFAINQKKYIPPVPAYFPPAEGGNEGYLIPFGDGPRPLYRRRVGKSVICNLLSHATRYVWITTPYLIIDNDLCSALESAALRGVDVRILLPHIPDKKAVFAISRSFYHRLMEAGVKIFEYTPGFIHGKNYLADDDYGMIGSINLDYRSLVHHFENGIWMYRTPCLADMKRDMEETLAVSQQITAEKPRLHARIFRAVIRIFAPLL